MYMIRVFSVFLYSSILNFPVLSCIYIYFVEKIMKRNKFYFVFIVLIVQLELFAESDIYFSKIGIEQGLSQLSVMSIYQDELGAIWFGTREGVNRYNGNTMEVFRPEPTDSNSLNGSLVKNICGDKNGHVYIHSQNGINEYRLKTGEMKIVQRDRADAIAYGVRNLWIAEDNYLYTYIDGVKTLYLKIKEIKSPIRTILQTADQRIVLGTLSSGVYIVDQNKKIRQVIPDCSQVSSLYEDNRKNIWVGTWEKGLFKIERNGNIRNYQYKDQHSISSSFVRAITQDNKDFLWIGTRKGLDKLAIDSEVFKHYNSGGTQFLELTNESVWSLYKDIQGTIWTGTYFGGVNYFNPEIDFYTFHDLRQGSFMNKPFPIISEIIEDKNGQLLLCSEGDGLIIYNPETRTYRNIRAGSEGAGLTTDNIKVGYYDAETNELWLGTHLGGVVRVNMSNLSTKQIRHLRRGWEQSDIVRAIVPYQNKLLVATYNGLFLLDKITGQVQLFSDALHKKVAYFVDLRIIGDELWMAGQGLHCYNVKTGRLKSYTTIQGDSTSLSNNNVMKLLVDSKKRLWIGTNGGGVNLYDRASDKFIRFDSKNAGLKNDYISNMMESKFGYVFISTTHGLSILDAENKKTFNYASENGFPLNSLFNGGMRTLRSGEIYVAGMNGMVSFFEENLSTPQRPFNLHLVNMWINNKLVVPGDQSGVLEASLPYTKSIKLNHKQSMLTIEFATNNYISFNQPLYRYRLEGFSENWTELPAGINKLNFMNLNPGKYQLVMQAISSVDKTPIASTYLQMQVFPPFYQSWYAYLFYVLLIIFIVWRYLIFTRSKLLLKASLAYEMKEKEHIEEVNQSKLRFFTNISHEFRTPLTLIAGQVDMLLQMSNIQPTVFNRILNIKRNTLNMQNLINELLEFRKSEQGHLNVKVVQRDFTDFLYEIYLSFTEYANYRNIKFEFESGTEHLKLWFDPIQMQKVFYNLISNAFKYTPKEGSIIIKTSETVESVVVEIIDSGIGIAPEAIEKIFDRFYQAENGLQINNMAPGTGIGLALTKNILEAHGAIIHVESTKEVGSKFIVSLRKGAAHFSDEQKIQGVSNEDASVMCLDELDQEFMSEMIEGQVQDGGPIYSMLIVEDNDELRQMLQQVFEPLYKIFTAADGEEGLALTIEHQPDIVLSDLMMPKMSGSEMCSKIKNNFLVCHIPVVLLTAQTAIEYNIEGLRLGADDYITKPFNVKTLITRCNNLVNNRRILQEKFSKLTDFAPRLIATNQLDREFLEKAQQVVEAHIDDSEFDVPAFSREMALGRTRLFTKIKGITGQTPNDFILNVRLKKAAQMLTNHPEYNISDITYMLGFSSPKYFAKCFKEQFGVSPSAYRKTEETAEEMEEEPD